MLHALYCSSLFLPVYLCKTPHTSWPVTLHFTPEKCWIRWAYHQLYHYCFGLSDPLVITGSKAAPWHSATWLKPTTHNILDASQSNLVWQKFHYILLVQYCRIISPMGFHLNKISPIACIHSRSFLRQNIIENIASEFSTLDEKYKSQPPPSKRSIVVRPQNGTLQCDLTVILLLCAPTGTLLITQLQYFWLHGKTQGLMARHVQYLLVHWHNELRWD